MDTSLMTSIDAMKPTTQQSRFCGLDSPKSPSRALQESNRSTSLYSPLIPRSSKLLSPPGAPVTVRRVIERPQQSVGAMPSSASSSVSKSSLDQMDANLFSRQRRFPRNRESRDANTNIVCPTPTRPLRLSPILERPILVPPSICAPEELRQSLPSLMSDLAVSPFHALSRPSSPSNLQICVSTSSLQEVANAIESLQPGYFQYLSTHKSWPLPETALASPTRGSYEEGPSTTYTLWPTVLD